MFKKIAKRLYDVMVTAKDLIVENKEGAIGGAILYPPCEKLIVSVIKTYTGIDLTLIRIPYSPTPSTYALDTIITGTFVGIAIQEGIKYFCSRKKRTSPKRA